LDLIDPALGWVNLIPLLFADEEFLPDILFSPKWLAYSINF